MQRGLAVLDYILQRRHAGASVVELVRGCALQRATIYRLLATLMAGGYVEKRGRFRYVLGPWFANPAVAPADNLAARLQPVLQRVSQITEDAAFAVVREGSQAHCVARQIGTFPVQVLSVRVDHRQPLGVGAAGLALLASLSDSEAFAIIEANASALLAFGGMTPERLTMLVKATRERGWSVVGNHAVADVLGVGCTVAFGGAAPAVAISVAAPIQRMSQQRQAVIVKTIRESIHTLLGKDM